MTSTAAASFTPTLPTQLLGLARQAIRAHLGLGVAPAIPESGPLALHRGAFVTLSVNNETRGAVGTFSTAASLARTVADMAVRAACGDPRCAPLRPDELERLEIAIAAVAPPTPLHDVNELRVGQEGVSIRLGWHRGTLLPRIAREQGWDGPLFLERACLKSGLPPSAWRDAQAVVEHFAVEECSTN